MKHALIAVGVIVVAVMLGSMAHFASSSGQTRHFDPLKIIAAAKLYASDLDAKEMPVPTQVFVKELIERHFLSESDIHGLEGAELAINLRAGGSPQDALVWARYPDGRELVLLADGSVQDGLPGQPAR